MNEEVEKTFLILERVSIPAHSDPNDSEASVGVSNSTSGMEKLKANKRPPVLISTIGLPPILGIRTIENLIQFSLRNIFYQLLFKRQREILTDRADSFINVNLF